MVKTGHRHLGEMKAGSAQKCFLKGRSIGLASQERQGLCTVAAGCLPSRGEELSTRPELLTRMSIFDSTCCATSSMAFLSERSACKHRIENTSHFFSPLHAVLGCRNFLSGLKADTSLLHMLEYRLLIFMSAHCVPKQVSPQV